MGLIKTAAKVAVASSVHGRVKRRQQLRWAEQDAAGASTAPAPPPPPPSPAAAATPSGSTTTEMLTQLRLLGELRDSGVLTDAEFEQKKAVILAG